MKRIETFILAMLWVLNSNAHEFSTHWISYPIPNDSSEVLFCHVFPSQGKPKQGSITFASCGRIKVFVNERNISPKAYFCNPDSTTVFIYTYDITRFLQPHKNTIAVWYAPESGGEPSKQLSMEYYGYDAKGKYFYHKANGDWKCCTLKGCYVKKELEAFDACSYDNQWKSPDFDRSKWLNPLGAYNQSRDYRLINNPFERGLCTIRHIMSPIDVYRDQKSIYYDFGKVFKGTPRITLREAKRKETINMDGFIYTCNGELDEQAFRRFTNKSQRIINADKAAAAKVKAPPLAAVRTVHHGAVLIHSQHGVVVQPAQPLGHAVPAAQLHRVALRKVEHKEIRLQLSRTGGDRRHRQTAAVGGKGHPHRGALRAGHIPVQLFAHGGGVHGQPGGAVGGIGGHCQRAGVRHGAQIDAVFQRFAVQVLGAAFHPQLVAGAVVQHKAGLARSQRRAGVAALDAGKAGTAKAIHRTGILVHGHKAAGHGLHGRQLAKTGLLRPAHRRGKSDVHRIHQILYPGDGCTHRAGGKQSDQYQRRQKNGSAA